MTTASKLWLGLGTLTALLVLCLLIIIMRLSLVRQQVNEMATVSRPRSATARELEVSVVEYMVAVYEYIHQGELSARTRAAEHAADVEAALGEYKRLAGTDQQRDLADRFTVIWTEMHGAGGILLRPERRPTPAELSRFSQRRDQLDVLLNGEMQTNALEAYDDLRDTTLREVQNVLGFAVLLMSLGGMIALVTTGAVGRGILSAERSLNESRERLQLAARSARFGTFELDLETGRNFWSHELKVLAGLPEDDELIAMDRVLSLVHPEDRQRVTEKLQQSFDPLGSGEFEDEHRLVRPDGSTCWVLVKAQTTFVRQGEGRQPRRALGLVLDITARKETERQLRESESRYRLVGQAANDAIWDWDLVTNQVTWNEGVQTRFGYTPDDVGEDAVWWYEQIHHEDRDRIVGGIHHAIDGGEHLWQAEYRFRRGDGTYAEVFDRGRIVHDEMGQPIRMVGSMLDLTERKRAEAELARFKFISDHSVEAHALIDRHGRYIYVNATHCRMHGYTQQEMIGKHLREIDPHVSDERFHEIFSAGLKANLAPFESLHRRQDGSLFPVEVATTVVKFDGEPFAFAATRDITERKLAEDAIRQSEERFRAYFESSAVPLWEEDWSGAKAELTQLVAAGVSDMRAYLRDHSELVGRCLSQVGLLDTNQASLELFCAPDKASLLQHLDRLIAPESWNVIADLLCAIAEGQTRYRGEECVVTLTGEKRQVIFDFVALAGFEHSLRRVLVSLVDVTEIRRAEAALKDSDRRKDEFLATLAHELRNPLAPVRNAVQLLHMKGPATPELQWARDVIDRQMQQMTRLIDDLMDVSRISRGKIQLRKERVELANVIQGAVETSRPIIEERRHQLTVNLPPEPIQLEADLTRLAQVFLNLLNNAAKYTESGGHIWLTAERQGSDVVISVKDTGIGIAADQLSGIFGMFAQVDGSIEKSQGGLGIGLTLVKQLVEMHGGSIEARSEGIGRGSEFVTRLPIDVAATVPSNANVPATPILAKSTLRILVVDDNRDGANSLAMMLRVCGNETQTAYDGAEGVLAAAEFQPDVVLLDIGLPKLNGYEACRRIREQAGDKPIILVAVTGWGQEEDRRRSQEAGFDYHLVKPVEPQTLMTMLNNFADTLNSQQPQVSPMLKLAE